MKVIRELEQNYLAVTSQIGELLQKKSAAYAVQADIEKVHRRLQDLGRTMLGAEDPRFAEQEYLAASREIQDLLHRKAQVYTIGEEIERMHGQLMEIGQRLGWAQSEPVNFQDGATNSDAGPEVDDKLHRLQRQIEDLRTVLN